MNIHGFQLHPKVAIYVVKQLKNDSFRQGLYVSIISEQSERIEGPVQCYRCGEIFESMELVKEHQTEKYQVARKSAYGKERPIQCHVCKYMFETEEKKSYHMCRSVGGSKLAKTQRPPRKLLRSVNIENNLQCPQLAKKTNEKTKKIDLTVL